MRVGVTGAAGLLGSTLVPLWRAAGVDVVPWTLADFDVSDAGATREAVRSARPAGIVHAAGYTAVDRAESESEVALLVNQAGTAHVAAAAAAAGAWLVYISTDYVFDGRAAAPIGPGADLAPLGAYARSKAAGEVEARRGGGRWMILRSGWLYGPGGRNFVDTMREAALERREVRVVTDQWGAPTSTLLLSRGLLSLARGGAGGIWHLTASGSATWFEVARAVYRAAGASADLVVPCSTAELGRPAPRPAYSVLDSSATEAAVGFALPAWEVEVEAYVRTGRLPDGGSAAEGGS